MRRCAPLLVALVAALATLPGAAAAAEPSRCAALTPRALVFERPTGGISGVLRWKPSTRASRRSRTRFRVYRDGLVVGQTPRRTMRIRVRVGRTYRLTVAAVNAAGRATRCRARIVVRDSYRLPSAPRMVTVGATDGASTTISWEPSQPGDSLVAAYRVLRDDRMYRQTRGTAVPIPLSSNRSASFTVTAVDRRGVVSAPSETVRITTGHAPPPTPRDVRVSEVTDSAVALDWTPSVPSRGRLAGYRVIRDGVPLFQVRGDVGAGHEPLVEPRVHLPRPGGRLARRGVGAVGAAHGPHAGPRADAGPAPRRSCSRAPTRASATSRPTTARSRRSTRRTTTAPRPRS